MGFYILEAGLLAASRLAAYSLLGFSQELAGAGRSDYLLSVGSAALESMDFVGETLHLLAFCFGAILFYFLLFKSGVIPRPLSLWGLITVSPLLVESLTAVFDYHLPFVLFVPYVPFEFVVGIWILVKGVPQNHS